MVIDSYSDETGSLRWEGFVLYVSPDGTSWSSAPYTKDQKEYDKKYLKNSNESERIINLIEKKDFTLRYLYDRILEGTSTLPKHTREWFLEHYFDGLSGIGRGSIVIGNN